MKDLLKFLADARKYPRRFCEMFWPGAEEWQLRVFDSLKENRRTSLVCCNGAGKTWVAARAVIWFLLTHPGSVVVTTAGTWQQIRRQLWKEIISARLKLPAFLQMGRINTVDWNLTGEWHAIGVSTNEVSHFEGFHARYILVVVDEAKSVRKGIFDAVNRIFAGNSEIVRLLVMSSPGEANGPHYESHHSHAEIYARIKVSPFESYYESPSGGGRISLPPTAHLSEEYIKEIAYEYGTESPLYRSMVLAEWTEDQAWGLFKTGDLDDAKLDVDTSENPLVIVSVGADVARNRGDGDECSFHAVERWETPEGKQFRIIGREEFFTEDATVFGDKLKNFVLRHKGKASRTNVDGTGLGGPVCDYLKREGFPVNCIQFGSAPTISSPVMTCMRDQLWWNGSEIVRTKRLHNLTDTRTIAQMVAVRYGYQTGSGRWKVEPKETTATRLKEENPTCYWKSPDRADSLLLALHDNDREIGDIRILASQVLSSQGVVRE